jgi:hypothetical protein
MNNYRRFYMRKALFHYPWRGTGFRRRYLLGCLKAFPRPASSASSTISARSTTGARNRRRRSTSTSTAPARSPRRRWTTGLENRIPRPVRRLLQNLPAWLAARALLKAIRAHAWTFAGNARVSIAPGHPAIIEIRSNPIAVPGCPWHRGVFETLFSGILGKPVHVDHSTLFDGQSCDRFMVRWNV